MTRPDPGNRPEILFPLFAGIETLPGIGPRLAPLIAKLAGERVVDLLWHLPTGFVDRRAVASIAVAEPGRVQTLTVTVGRHAPPQGRNAPYRVTCSDPEGEIDLVFFNPRPDYLLRILPTGEDRVVSGRVDLFNERFQIVHPDHVVPVAERDRVIGVEPTYPLTQGVNPAPLRKAIQAAVKRLPDLDDWADPALVKAQAWPGWRDAMVGAHAPQAAGDLSAGAPARRRLAHDEMLAHQLALLLIRRRQRRAGGRSLDGDGRLRTRLRAALPFALTGGQEAAVAEIDQDMAAPTRMLRLLQGDVGSGKTVVALIAMLAAAECGVQAALMAPTEILAQQHLATMAPLAESIGVELALLTGTARNSPDRPRVLEKLADGSLPLVVGTHALFQDTVAFHDLGLVVVDEQHRFGVAERLKLSAKGRHPDVLVMTATPIPRTLTLTAYGDMDVTRLTERPPGRLPIDTRAIPMERMGDIVDGLKRALAQGQRAYWVCPLVEESESVDLAAATDRHAHLSQVFGERVGLVHGRLKPAEKDAVMADFAGGRLDVLVATTVIEVGVNVPDATVMVIEHADRFGLAQLHQLRGRVGRGNAQGTCLLLYDRSLSEVATRRLKTLRETDDGFVIAEEDLALRGAGELLGTRQSGLPDYRLTDLSEHGDLIDIARKDAMRVVETDPGLESDRGRRLRVLLHLFERREAVRYLASG